MRLRLLSFNIHIWVKDRDPREKKWWIPRTLKIRSLLLRKMKMDDDEMKSPDVICIQERMWPIGKILLGLWGYKAFGGWRSRTPIYVKRDLIKKYNVRLLHQFHTTEKENGHGINVVAFANFNIQNSHYSFERELLEEEIRQGFLPNTIFCGDFNKNKYYFTTIYKSVRDDELLFFDKIPEGAPTYKSYENPDTVADIDYVGTNFGFDTIKAKCRILPDELSDHYPILAEIEL